MPKNVVSIENMRKHLTPAEREARLSAQQALTRSKVRLVAPTGVKNNLVAYGYWKTLIRQMREITLLDDLDSGMLAIYCEGLARRDWLSGEWGATRDVTTLQRLEAQERLLIQYAERLGLTPSGRVRLAKRRAEEKPVDPDGDLYGDRG